MEEIIEEEVADMDELFLPVRPREQVTGYACGPVALRVLIRYMSGIELTEQDLILLTGATEDGTSEYHLMRALDMLGFKYTQSTYGTFNKLKKLLQNGQPSIVHTVVRDGEGHYMVFCGYDANNVELVDSTTGKIVKYGIPFFLGIWKIEEGETQTRWYLSITGHVGDRLDMVLKRLKRIQKKVRNARK